jgi:agmatine/peptidylarginine deiminase
MTLPQTQALVPEWEPQTAVFLAWPYFSGDFQPWLESVEKTYIEIAKAIAARQALWVACRDADQRSQLQALFEREGIDLGSVSFVVMPYNDVWVRDTAPLTVSSAGSLKCLDFRFNGWGGKYECADDAQIAQRLHASGTLLKLPMEAVDFVLEGGSIEIDGAGTIMTTTRCLLNPNRNPSFTQAAIAEVLRVRLGGEQVLWLEHGYAEGDDTDAHVDTLARFCSPNVIAYTASDRPEDPVHAGLSRMEAQLEGFRNREGQPYTLVPLPIPAPIYSEEGDRLPATYANFLIINRAVLVPVYGDPKDRVALERLKAVFPDRELVPIDCVPLIRQYGSLHCMTMQFPTFH